MQKEQIFEQIHHGLIVSCQALSPFTPPKAA